MALDRYLIIHGHFYQPPRENAWLEEIELQDSALPFHDWNERITAECYGPNASSRILNDNQEITDIVNNYSKISFNYGPTLLSWMEEHAPDVYRNILKADMESRRYFGGHGNALAQVYNHIIMPLANRRDKETQVIWGIADFRMRFGREPEGMWLAETAVDLETLEVLAENGILFTILAPRQAKQFRKIGDLNWTNVNHGIDTRCPYLCKLPSGKTITLFFYNGDVSQDVAFRGLLINGKDFANRLTSAFGDVHGSSRLVHIATDGESYGHHHRHGDMALAYCIHHIESNKLAKITNYGQYLSLFEPEFEVEIHENSSWSCVHGVERWRHDCGCNSGVSWHQKWRAPLRYALDWLRDNLEEVFERELKIFTPDVWAARNRYIDVILDRSEDNVNAFIRDVLGHDLDDEEEKTKFIRLLEMQRHALLMYTSCGWFFDDISGIETTQIMQYACRAIQLAERESNVFLEEEFEALLALAPSNLPEYGDGFNIYNKWVKSARVSLSRVGMHYAVASLFSDNPTQLEVLTYKAKTDFYDRFDSGVQKLAVGRVNIFSNITYSRKYFNFAVFYLGSHHLIGAGAEHIEDAEFQLMYEKIKKAFLDQNDVSEVIHVMQQFFGNETFSFWKLFRDQQQNVLNQIIQNDLEEAYVSYKNIYEQNYSIMNVLKSANLPVPRTFTKNLDLVINREIRRIFELPNLHSHKLKVLVDDAIKWSITVDKERIAYVATTCLNQIFKELREKPEQVDMVNRLIRVLNQMERLDIELKLWEMQNLLFKLMKKWHKLWQEKAKEGLDDYSKLSKAYSELALLIKLKVE